MIKQFKVVFKQRYGKKNTAFMHKMLVRLWITVKKMALYFMRIDPALSD